MPAQGRAGGRALWHRAGRRLLRREHVQPRTRRQQGGPGPSGDAAQAWRLPAAGYASSSPSTWRSSAPSRSRAAITGACWPRRWPAQPSSTATFRPASWNRSAVQHPEIVNRIFQRRERRAGSEHPAAEEFLRRFARAGLDDLEEGGALRHFLRRALVAGARRDLEGAELDHLVDGRGRRWRHGR